MTRSGTHEVAPYGQPCAACGGEVVIVLLHARPVSLLDRVLGCSPPLVPGGGIIICRGCGTLGIAARARDTDPTPMTAVAEEPTPVAFVCKTRVHKLDDRILALAGKKGG
jgi:hypothetical protein